MLSRLGNNRRKKRYAEDSLADLLGGDISEDTQESEPQDLLDPKPQKTSEEFDWIREFGKLESGFSTSEKDPAIAGSYEIWLTKSESGIKAGAKQDDKVVFQFETGKKPQVKDKKLQTDSKFKDFINWLRKYE